MQCMWYESAVGRSYCRPAAPSPAKLPGGVRCCKPTDWPVGRTALLPDVPAGAHLRRPPHRPDYPSRQRKPGKALKQFGETIKHFSDIAEEPRRGSEPSR